MILVFKSSPKKEDLIDQLDMEIEEHRRVSNILKKAYSTIREEASELLEDSLDEAAKYRLKSALHYRKLRVDIENRITNLQTARWQVVAQTLRPTFTTLQNVGKLLRESRIDREKTLAEIESISPYLESDEITVLSETFETEDQTLEQEFLKLKQEKDLVKPEELRKEEPLEFGLPEVPKEEIKKIDKKEEKEKDKILEG